MYPLSIAAGNLIGVCRIIGVIAISICQQTDGPSMLGAKDPQEIGTQFKGYYEDAINNPTERNILYLYFYSRVLGMLMRLEYGPLGTVLLDYLAATLKEYNDAAKEDISRMQVMASITEQGDVLLRDERLPAISHFPELLKEWKL